MTSYYMSFAGRKKLVFSHLFLLLYPSSSTKEFLVFTSMASENPIGQALFLCILKKTQVRKKLRFALKNSGFSGKTQVFVNFQLTLLHTPSRKLRYFSKNSGIFRKTQVFGYFSDQCVVVKVRKKRARFSA